MILRKLSEIQGIQIENEIRKIIHDIKERISKEIYIIKKTKTENLKLKKSIIWLEQAGEIISELEGRVFDVYQTKKKKGK